MRLEVSHASASTLAGVFSQGFEALFPCAGALHCAVSFTFPACLSMHECGVMGSASCLTPCSKIRHLTGSTSRCLAASSLHPGCLVVPLLLVWMNVSSLSPSLLDFHAVRFSDSSGCFLFLNCCCPSFGCVRRCSVSTYASILARSPEI